MNFCPSGCGWVVVHRVVRGGLLSTTVVSELLFIDVRVPLLSDCSEFVGGSWHVLSKSREQQASKSNGKPIGV